jgi:membrane protein implicated in regulation of membrane protease activity
MSPVAKTLLLTLGTILAVFAVPAVLIVFHAYLNAFFAIVLVLTCFVLFAYYTYQELLPEFQQAQLEEEQVGRRFAQQSSGGGGSGRGRGGEYGTVNQPTQQGRVISNQTQMIGKAVTPRSVGISVDDSVNGYFNERDNTAANVSSAIDDNNSRDKDEQGVRRIGDEGTEEFVIEGQGQDQTRLPATTIVTNPARFVNARGMGGSGGEGGRDRE